MPFSKPLYFDNILYRKAGTSRKSITKYIADICDETNKSLLDIIDENKLLDNHSFYSPSARQFAEVQSTTLKRLARSHNDYFVCRLSRPNSTVFSEADAKPFIISYRGRLCTGSRLSSLDTKHEVTPNNPSYFSPYAYLETVIVPADETTAGMLSHLISNSSPQDITTFGKLFATPISDRMHLPFEYSDDTCSYERPTLCSCLVADAVVLFRKNTRSPSIKVFRIKNNIISHCYTFDIPQKETPLTPNPSLDEMLKLSKQLEEFERFTSAVSPVTTILNQDAISLLNSSANYINIDTSTCGSTHACGSSGN